MPTFYETTDAAASTATTYNLTAGQSIQGNLAAAGDHDFYRITLTAGTQYTFNLIGTGGTNVIDPYLRLYASNGTTLVVEDDDGLVNNNSRITYTPVSSGTYYLDAGAFNNAGAGEYTLTTGTVARDSFDIYLRAAMLDGDASWSASAGTPATVTYAYRQTVDITVARDADGNPVNTGTQLTPEEQAAVQTALSMYSEVAGLTFQHINPLGFSDNATILIANYSANDNAGAYAYYPGSTAAANVAGDIWLNTTSVSTTDLPAGSYSYFALIHEMGHAMGLSHPGNYNAGAVDPTYALNAEFTEDSHQYSIMSYFDESDTGAVFNSFPDTLMLSDVYFLQQTYGANMTTRSGNSTYGFNSNVGGVYNFSTNLDPALCIWDGGGTDTIDLSGYGTAQILSLQQGAFSNVGGLTRNLSIAYGAVIENAIGGSAGDTFTGNDANNTLTGNGGGDSLSGNGGDDVLIGGTGADTLDGGTGSDTASYTYSALGVTVDLTAGNSWDGAAMDFLFSVENAIGTNATDTLAGNSSDNIFEGLGGVDFIQGGLGSDTASYRSAAVGVQVDLSAQYAWDGAAMDFLNSIENSIGSAQSDILVGNGGDNIIEGLGGVDFVQGGGGTDYASYRSATVGVQVDLANQYSWDGAAMDFFTSIEGAIGSAQSDILVGSAGNDIFEGLGGVDFINGGSGGSDTASYRTSTSAVQVDLASQYSWDGSSTDFFTSIENAIGSAQGDNFFGSTGVNVFEGLAGNDIMTGNGGNDFFRFAASGTGADTITDFDSDATGGQDFIDLTGRGFFAGSFNNGTIMISGNAANTLITIGSDTITLSGVNVATVNSADFIF